MLLILRVMESYCVSVCICMTGTYWSVAWDTAVCKEPRDGVCVSGMQMCCFLTRAKRQVCDSSCSARITILSIRLEASIRLALICLVGNSISDKLEPIIRSGRVTPPTLLNQAPHVISRLPLALIQHKAIAEVLHTLGFEAR